MLQQERNIVYEAVPPAQETQPAPDTREYSSTYTVISKVAYLIGVPKKFFEAEYAPPQLQTFDQMEREKNARIIRDLCRLRTAIEQNYGRINKAFLYDLKNLHTLPEYIPQECLRRLSEDGIELLRANYKLTQYIIDINLHIANRINNCRDLLPLWLKWEYVRELFLMPNGTKEAGLKRAAEEYCANRTHYPYQVYINWPAQEEQGNILHNDKKFITLLYEMHEDYFADFSKVSDAAAPRRRASTSSSRAADAQPSSSTAKTATPISSMPCSTTSTRTPCSGKSRRSSSTMTSTRRRRGRFSRSSRRSPWSMCSSSA